MTSTLSTHLPVASQSASHVRTSRRFRGRRGSLVVALFALCVALVLPVASPVPAHAAWLQQPMMYCKAPYPQVSVDVGMRTWGVYQVWLWDWQAGKYVDVKEGISYPSSGPGGNHGIVRFNALLNRQYSAYIYRWNSQGVKIDEGWVQVYNPVWQPTGKYDCWNI